MTSPESQRPRGRGGRTAAAAIRATRRARRAVSVGPRYPHDIHPALVPGVSIEDQRHRYTTDHVVFGIAAVLIVAFIVWGLVSTESLSAVSSAALTWVVSNTGWLFNVLAIVMLGYMLVIGFGPTGRIPLGVDGEKPEFSRFSWIAMLFSAGVGIGLFFFGPYEPLTYFMDPPAPGVAPESPEAMHKALAQTVFHWGLQAWAMYAFVGAALAYGAYRRGRVPLLSSILTPWLGADRTGGPLGRVVDVLAIVATLFGTAASLGIGATQVGRGIEIVAGLDQLGNDALILVIAVLTAAFIASAVSGVAKGIRILSNINMTLAALLTLFVFLAGPTLLLLNLVPSGVMQYLGDMPEMLGRSASWGPEAAAFSEAWTIFYWAWWVSWTPFVGMFIARISRGRTLREFVTVVLLAPLAVCVASFTVYGGTTMWLRAEGGPVDLEQSPQDLLFTVLQQLPGAGVTTLVAMVCISIFFVTSADSASLVMGMLSQRGATRPAKKVVVFWGLAMMGIAVVMLLIGGGRALQGLQNLIIVSALPLAFVIIAMLVAFWHDLHRDPLIIRRRFADVALAEAVRQGVAEHGNDFGLAVVAAEPARGAGRDFDAHAPEHTDWYRRTDEDGHPVDYDYATGEYADGWTPDDDATGSGAPPRRR